MQLTTIEKCSATDTVRALALALFPTISWRHHGIGVLQGYVVENTEPEVRLHVWAPELVKVGMSDSGDCHDHRFDLVSHVLAGTVGHEELFPEEDDAGDWAMLSLTHARAAKENAYHGPTTPLAGRFRVHRNAFAIPEGHVYQFPKTRFHRSPVIGALAITCVEKRNQSDSPARILHPVAAPPVMAFGHEMDWAVVGPVLHRAHAALKSGS